MDIRIPAADMRENHHVVAAFAKRLIELGDRVGIGIGVAPILEKRVRASPDGTTFFGEDDVAVTANSRIAGPLIAGKCREPSGLVPVGRHVVQMLPETVLDLKVIPLMADNVEEGLVAGEIHIVLDPSDPDGLAALAMKIAPVTRKPAISDYNRACCGNGVSLYSQRKYDTARRCTADVFNRDRLLCPVEIDEFRQSLDRSA